MSPPSLQAKGGAGACLDVVDPGMTGSQLHSLSCFLSIVLFFWCVPCEICCGGVPTMSTLAVSPFVSTDLEKYRNVSALEFNT